MDAQKASLAIAAFLCAFAVGARASATASFPSEVEKHLGLAAGAVSTVAPPDGCRLCHVNGSAGGDPLTQFGTLMKSSGAVKNENATVDGALDAIQVSNPNLITDIENGVDPNHDPDAGAVNLGLAPHYGCGSVSSGRASGWSAALVVAAMAAGLARRRLKARANHRAPAPGHRHGDQDGARALVARGREINHNGRRERGATGRKRDGRSWPSP
jgi:hypothetical protein